MMRWMIVLVTLLLVVTACKSDNLPYKFVSDTKPVGVKATGAAVVTTSSVPSPSAPVPVASSQQAITWACKDSDFGDVVTAHGIISGKNPDGATFTYEDECFGGILLENNCADGKPESHKVRCERGCQNGFCI